MSQNAKFVWESYLNSKESLEQKWITSTLITIVNYALSIMKMNAYNGNDDVCDKYYETIATYTRTSVPTVKRVLKVAYEKGLLTVLERGKNGKLILGAGKWFDTRKKINKCGTAVYNPVHNNTPPAHSEPPSQLMVSHPPAHSEPLIHNAFTDFNTKELKGKQAVNYLNIEKQKEASQDDPAQLARNRQHIRNLIAATGLTMRGNRNG